MRAANSVIGVFLSCVVFLLSSFASFSSSAQAIQVYSFDAINAGTAMQNQQTMQYYLDRIASAGGGEFRIRKGRFELNMGLHIGSNTRVVGDGMNDTILVLKNQAKPWISGQHSYSGFLRVFNASNVHVMNMTLDGNRQNQQTGSQFSYGKYGIYSERTENISFRWIRVRNFQGYGFDPHGTKKPPIYSNNTTIEDCVAENNGLDGFTVDQSDGVLLRNNLALNNSRHGINVVTGSVNVLIHGNRLQGNGVNTSSCGVMVQSSKLNNIGHMLPLTRNITIEHNVIESSRASGLCIYNAKDVIASNNSLRCATCYSIGGNDTVRMVHNVCIGYHVCTKGSRSTALCV
jgi:parallel beta-helix repeat protein